MWKCGLGFDDGSGSSSVGSSKWNSPATLERATAPLPGCFGGGSSGLHPPDTRPRRRATEVPQVAPQGLTAPAHLGRQGGPVRAVRRSARGKGEGEASSAFPSMAPDCTPPPAADGAMIAVANAPQSSHNATRVRALAGQGKSTQKRRGSWEMRGAGPVSWSAVNEQAGKHAALLEVRCLGCETRRPNDGFAD